MISVPDQMKTICYIALFGTLLLTFNEELPGQERTESDKLLSQLIVKDRRNANLTVQKIDNPNYADIYDRTLLMYASADGYTKVCRTLLRKGADPDLDAIDGTTAAMYAAYNGKTKIIKLLMREGVRVDFQTIDGFNALMLASQNGHTRIVKLLLEKGANPNLQAYDGFSPLDALIPEWVLRYCQIIARQQSQC